MTLTLERYKKQGWSGGLLPYFLYAHRISFGSGSGMGMLETTAAVLPGTVTKARMSVSMEYNSQFNRLSRMFDGLL